MIIEPTEIFDVKIIMPEKYGDHRGFFSETYNSEKLNDGGIKLNFCQDNHSFSQQIGTLRGLHFQMAPFAQDKLVRVSRGAIYDVAVDIRVGSPTYGKWVGRVISAELWNQILVPKGFAHGFICLSEIVRVNYQVDNYYSLENEFGINPFDNDLKINWILKKNQIIISDRDKTHKNLSESPVYKF